jgi:outer membrane protein assembly factor BamB
VKEKYNIHMTRTSSPRRLVVALFLLIVVTVGCAPTRIGVSWAGLTTIGERQNILVTYNELISLVDPATGDEVTLLNEEGTPRINPETNQPRQWEISGIQGAQFYAVPLRLNDSATLIAADYNGRKLFRVDTANARVENPAGVTIDTVGGQIVADLVSDGTRLFLPMANHDLRAIELNPFLENGTLNNDWTFETDNGIWDAPLLHEEVLYFGAMNHQFYAVNADNGSLLWEVDLDGAVAGTPALYNDKLYVGSFARRIFEISLEGEILRTYTTENWVWGSPVVVDGILYAADMGGYAYALNVEEAGGDTLPEVWKTKATGRGIRPSPLVTEDYVIVAGRDGHVDWLNMNDGTIAFMKEAQAEILSDILLIEPTEELSIPEPLVVISTIDRSKLLMAFRLSDGAQSWVYAR